MIKQLVRHRSSRRRGFGRNDRQLALWAKALGHPARIAILRFLAAQKACFCGRIVDEIPLAQSTVSQHLRELKEAGLICGTVEGVKVCYCLNPTAVQALGETMGEYLGTLAACASDEPLECRP